jgi:hypothetical protein
MIARMVSDRRLRPGMLVCIKKTKGSVAPASFASARPRIVMLPKTLQRRCGRRLTGPVIGFAMDDFQKVGQCFCGFVRLT